MDSFVWQKIDLTNYFAPSLDETDDCRFAREYIVDSGYDASEANNLINNFKKDPKFKGQNPWYYKERAVRQFAREISMILSGDGIYHIAFIPPSKTCDDPEYDPRFEMLKEELARLNDRYRFYDLIKVKESHQSVHSGGERDIEFLKSKITITEGLELTHHIILVDDVLTSGAHFKACKSLIMEKYPDIEVVGVFWTKAVHKSFF